MKPKIQLRDVEPNVNLWVQTLEKDPVALEEDE